MVYRSIGEGATSWAGKTYAEVVKLAERDDSILVVPVGSLEQHGYHLPVVTDTVLADAAAQAGAERTSDDIPILVAPPVVVGYSPHHLPFGGTMTLEVDTFISSLREMAQSAVGNGFDSLLFVNGHTGNESLMSSAVSAIGVKHPDVRPYGLTYFRLVAPFIDEIRESDVGGMGHGGEFETSLLLHLRPDLVREDQVTKNYRDEPHDQATQDMFRGGPLNLYRPFTEYSSSGVVGDPTLASAEKGERIYEILGEELEALLTEIHEENR